MIIDNEMVMLFLVVPIEDQNISHDAVVSTVVTRPNSDLELRVLILSHPWRDLRLGPLIHGHLCHCTSCAFATILFEVLRTVLIVRIALVRHLAAAIHDVVTVAGSVGLTNTTEVDVDSAVGLLGNPDVVAILMRNTSLGGNRLLVFATLVAFGLDLFESRLKSLGARVELRFGTLELSTCTLVLCLGGIEGALARIKVILCTLEGGLGCFVSDASRANFFDQPTTLGDVTLSFRLVAVAIGCVAGSTSTVTAVMSRRRALSNADFML